MRQLPIDDPIRCIGRVRGVASKFAKQESVEARSREPLWPTGCRRDNIDVLDAHAALAQQTQRVRSGAKGEGVHGYGEKAKCTGDERVEG